MVKAIDKVGINYMTNAFRQFWKGYEWSTAQADITRLEVEIADLVEEIDDRKLELMQLKNQLETKKARIKYLQDHVGENTFKL